MFTVSEAILTVQAWESRSFVATPSLAWECVVASGLDRLKIRIPCYAAARIALACIAERRLSGKIPFLAAIHALKI